MADKDEIVKQLNEYRRANLESYKSSGVVKQIEILAAENSCEECKSLNGRKFNLDENPTLPIKNCKREWCRCTYLPVVD